MAAPSSQPVAASPSISLQPSTGSCLDWTQKGNFIQTLSPSQKAPSGQSKVGRSLLAGPLGCAGSNPHIPKDGVRDCPDPTAAGMGLQVPREGFPQQEFWSGGHTSHIHTLVPSMVGKGGPTNRIPQVLCAAFSRCPMQSWSRQAQAPQGRKETPTQCSSCPQRCPSALSHLSPCKVLDLHQALLRTALQSPWLSSGACH